MLKQTVPEGYILGWGITGLNWPNSLKRLEIIIHLGGRRG